MKFGKIIWEYLLFLSKLKNMKKVFFLVVLVVINFSGFAQKKKVQKPVKSQSVVAKLDNVTAEMVKQNLFLISNANTKGVKKDSILIKSFPDKVLPLECKIVGLTPQSTKLYAVSWTEKGITTTKLKTEESTTVFTEICNLSLQKKVLSNVQTTTNVKEIHFLDSKQTVSETIQKVRKEGFELNLLPDGDVVLKNKTQENKLTYSLKDNKFVPKKK